MVNFRDRTMKVVFQDGQTVEEALEARDTPEESLVACTVFDWEKWWIHSLTTQDDWIVAEGFNPHSPPPFNGRLSVYLDQNRWRTVADALLDPSKVKDPDERRAALDLIRLSTDGGIVMPLSMGHLIEVAGLYGELRYRIGVAMAQLAGGWQMRNPLDLWKHEADLTMRKHLGTDQSRHVLHPITTEPGALFGRDTGLGVTEDTPEYDIFMAMLTMPSVILDALVEPERTPKDPLEKWTEHHRKITSHIHSQGMPKERRNNLARRRYWNENIAFYTSAYRRLTSSADFPTFSDRELKRLLSASPMVGLLSELFVRRFVDHQVKWSRNDLIDMFHLSSAAAYADHVAAETHTGTQLRAAQRALGRAETVHTTLDGLVTALRRDGARADSERALSRGL
ncbi:hypothetical protein [Nocardioides luteus]|uniref:hypothetical protein n=1 Tax=Nocardioides luteus TaxID=1844 RepID=UPI0018CA3E6A|nr:hypothetical protein [Nocardioides luteus]MBG6098787.1 hypothetical protein [Nocardioides luteus]